MRTFRLALVSSLAIGLAPVAMSGQSGVRKTATAANAAESRTPWGHPDLSGTWTSATLTPLERPDSAGGRLELSRAEAEAIAQKERDRNDVDAKPSDPNRPAPTAGGSVGGYNQFFFDRGSSATKIDGHYRSSLVVDPADGRIPPMTAEGRAKDAALGGPSARPDVVERARAAPGQSEPEVLFDNPEQRPLAERCIIGFGWTSGTPILPNYNYNNGKQIVQTPDSVLIFAEMVHDVRVVRLNGQHLPAQIRTWTGDSIGRWEGDTLVVETTNFTDKTRFQGSSDKLKVIERFRRLDDGTLLYRFTVDDPSTWTRPWSGEYTWERAEEPLYEYACHEGNYALGGVLRGARLRDSERAGKAGATR